MNQNPMTRHSKPLEIENKPRKRPERIGRNRLKRPITCLFIFRPSDFEENSKEVLCFLEHLHALAMRKGTE